MKFTIIGGTGFIGTFLEKYLKQHNIECKCPDIKTENIENQKLENVIYAAGVTDFIQKPFETYDAHVCKLLKILSKNDFDSFLYLSSTRLYKNNISTTEDESISVKPSLNNDLYDISKLAGESICLAQNNPKIKIVRLSNVSGNNFLSNLSLPSILRDIITKKKILLTSTLDSEKDYIHIDDVVSLLPQISLYGKNQIYNVAAGFNISNNQILKKIKSYFDFDFEVSKNSDTYSFPTMSITRLKNEFDFQPENILNRIEQMVNDYEHYFKTKIH